MPSSGIIIRQSVGNLMIRCQLTDIIGEPLSTGNAVLRLFQLLNDGTLAAMDFNDSKFKTGDVLLEGSINLDHQQAEGGTVNTGIWTTVIPISVIENHSLSTNVQIAQVRHDDSSPITQSHEFQIGGSDGDAPVEVVPTSVREVFTSCAYDHEAKIIRVNVFMELNGVPQDIRDCSVQIFDSSGTVASKSGLSNSLGQNSYYLSIDTVNPRPDDVYFVIATVKDMNNVVHRGGSSIITLD